MRICVATATRAEYGLLRPLIVRITNTQPQDNVQLQLIVTGTHLCEEYGLTVQEIEADQIRIDKKIDIILSNSSGVSIAKAMGLGLISFSEALDELKPDILVILGDRYEMLAMASAAMVLQIPIAHIHGGESTFGAIDEAIRHSITKMAYFHFTATKEYSNRVIQLGENPERVFHVGALGVENISSIPLLQQNVLEQQLKMPLGTLSGQAFLVTFHPETLGRDIDAQIHSLLNALDHFKDATLIITEPNADADSFKIRQEFKRFVARRKTYLFQSLGVIRYLSLLQYVNAVIGNSSSGIIEVPSFKIPTINIGDRQKGRVAADSVIHVGHDSQAIIKAVETALAPKMQKICQNCQNPYASPSEMPTSQQILMKLLQHAKDINLKKTFYDLDINHQN